MAFSTSLASSLPSLIKSSSFGHDGSFRTRKILFNLSPKPKLHFASKVLKTAWKKPIVPKAQLTEVKIDESTNSSPTWVTEVKETTPDKVPLSKERGASSKQEPLDDSSSAAHDSPIHEFMDQVSSLIKLVDSRDIVELQLKQLDCELIIRKKEAVTQPPSAPVYMQPSILPASLAYPPSGLVADPPPPPSTSPPPPSSKSAIVKKETPTVPPLTSPMAGTFYRRPAPEEPPFVKVGDKVTKGQVLCIIEAMKLMNEIEAEKPGTILEILVEDGKPVCAGAALFVIE